MPMTTSLSLQDAIARLHQFWGQEKCLIWLPMNTEVGAGTMNPATFLRVLGPEPWRVAYVEPSVRPDDSRYGQNPNRMQMHTQYQVILKPDPGNPQELYLNSLRSLGIDISKHDVRFVEDNWESPALGSWGLGWEVWLDGLEITQFTYFQQAGGIRLTPPAVEITYGLDRILMCLQGVDHFKKIAYSPDLTYGEVLGQNEYEMSVYNLDVADTERCRRLFELYEAEARMLLERKLPLPAYSYVLKTSHMFNLLDSRGTVGVAERALFFNRMRELSRHVATQWLELREEDGFPLGSARRIEAAPSEWVSDGSGAPASFLLEIGTEEMPPADVDAACEQLRRLIPEMLESHRLDYRDVRVDATPRRIAVRVRELAARQKATVREDRGPRVAAAYAVDGAPTPALLGFARSRGLELSQVQRRDFSGVEYIVAHVGEPALPAGEVLREALPKMIARIGFERGMRWDLSDVLFSRPIRWFVAMHGDRVIPFVYADVASGRASRGLRGPDASPTVLMNADDFDAHLEKENIVLRADERRSCIAKKAAALAAKVGGRIPDDLDELLDEVVHLTEAPVPILGRFAEDYLELPRAVLVTVMRKHQRYLPVEDHSGHLLPYFVAVANGNVDVDAVRAGNESVLRARYADARFYWDRDRQHRLEDYRPQLALMTFQEALGSMLDKSARIERLAACVASSIALPQDSREVLSRAAALAKADLGTQMVTEFSNLAGIMGEQYALLGGESPEVARAILEHTLPRSGADRVPQSVPGVILALADRIDSLVGLFAVGLGPKSSADPFALRRAALGAVRILMDGKLDLSLRDIVGFATRGFSAVTIDDGVQRQVLDFIRRRFEQWLKEQGFRADLIQAVLAARGDRPALALTTLKELSLHSGSEAFQRFLTAYSRPARLVRDHEIQARVDPQLFGTPEEHQLWNTLQEAAPKFSPQVSIAEVVDLFEPLVEPIQKFFASVFVMVDDTKVRDNRLALLAQVAGLVEGVAEFSVISEGDRTLV